MANWSTGWPGQPESSVCPVVLSREFYDRDPVTVAEELIGCVLLRDADGAVTSGRIVETEAYRGDDPASHAFRGPRPRNRTMFGPPGHLYVYRSHGIHFCVNVVTEQAGLGSAVLLRAVEPIDGVDIMRNRRGTVADRLLCAGPGRLSQAFTLALEHDGLDLVKGCELRIVRGAEKCKVVATPRIGISVAAERPWRFIDADSHFLSRPHRRH